MRVDTLYYNPFSKGKYLEKEDLAEEEYHGFRI